MGISLVRVACAWEGCVAVGVATVGLGGLVIRVKGDGAAIAALCEN